MKSFKMITFDLLTQEGLQNFPVIDGIIINQENSHHSWIIELFIAKEFQETFKTLQANNAVITARVVISFPDNEPAPFEMAVYSVKEIGDNISVLLKGKLKAKRKKYAEQLLAELLEEHLTPDELLARFEEGMKARPKLKAE